LPFDNQIAN